MKIIVPVKRVIDANIKVRVKSDQSGVETSNVKMAMNPFCEIAVEEALRIKEAGNAEEVIVVSAGAKSAQETIRTGLAMGADRGVHIESDADLEPLTVAKLLRAVVEKEAPDLVILGKQAIDGDNSQTGQMLAALLAWPQATFASRIVVNATDFDITREVDGGLEILTVNRPAIVTTDLRLNEPRYASLPNIMKAKKKPIDVLSPEDLGVDVTNRLTVVKVTEPPKRDAGVIVDSVDALIDKLRNEAKVI